MAKVKRTSAKLDLEMERGTTFTMTLLWTVGDPPVAVDLTDAVARMQIRPSAGSSTIYIELDNGVNGGLTLGGVNGTVAIEIDADTLAAETWSRGEYDLEIEFQTGVVRKLVRGTVVLYDEVTKPST